MDESARGRVDGTNEGETKHHARGEPGPDTDQGATHPRAKLAIGRMRKKKAISLLLGAVALALVTLGALAVYQELKPAPQLVITGDDAGGVRAQLPTDTTEGVEDPSEFVLPEGQTYGLWTGNVELLPERTEQLPKAFYEEPDPDARPQLPDGLLQQNVIKKPEEIATPLWVFADEADPKEAAQAVAKAMGQDRVVVIWGATAAELARAAGVAVDEMKIEGTHSSRFALVRKPGQQADEEKTLHANLIYPRDYFADSSQDLSGEVTPEDVYANLALWTLAFKRVFTEEEVNAQRWEQGAYYGYWAGNVEVIPARSDRLPSFFYEGPTPKPEPRVDSEGRVIFLDAELVPQPLWVLGDVADPRSAADRIKQVVAEGRPVIFYATPIAEAFELLGFDSSGGSTGDLAFTFVEYLPWEGQPGTMMVSFPVDEEAPETMSPEWLLATLAQATLQPPRRLGQDASIIWSRLYQGQQKVPALPIYSTDDFSAGWVPAEASETARTGNGLEVWPDEGEIPGLGSYTVSYAHGDDLAELSVNRPLELPAIEWASHNLAGIGDVQVGAAAARCYIKWPGEIPVILSGPAHLREEMLRLAQLIHD